MIVNQTTVKSGMSLSGWVFVVLLVLKLTGIASMSWWWVFAPFWLPVVAVLGFFGLLWLLAHLASWIAGRSKRGK